MSTRRLVATGLGAAVAAAALNAAVAAGARASGVDLEVTGGETVPVSGVAFVTVVFSVVGVGIAAALRKWSERPAQWWWRTTVALTAVSLVPPFLAATDTPRPEPSCCSTSSPRRWWYRQSRGRSGRPPVRGRRRRAGVPRDHMHELAPRQRAVSAVGP